MLAGLLVQPSVPAKAGGGGGSIFERNWLIADSLGSAQAMVAEDGWIVRETSFKPFGRVDQDVYGANPPKVATFAGHRLEPATDLYYMQARWMNPLTGTFLSVDPLVADAFDPQSVNAYSYARNNPVSVIDPTGMIGCSVGCTSLVNYTVSGTDANGNYFSQTISGSEYSTLVDGIMSVKDTFANVTLTGSFSMEFSTVGVPTGTWAPGVISGIPAFNPDPTPADFSFGPTHGLLPPEQPPGPSSLGWIAAAAMPAIPALTAAAEATTVVNQGMMVAGAAAHRAKVIERAVRVPAKATALHALTNATLGFSDGKEMRRGSPTTRGLIASSVYATGWALGATQSKAASAAKQILKSLGFM